MEFYIGQIIMFGGNFAIRSFAECNGQLLAISSNTALFSILGTTYGGDGRTTFGLPDLRGRVPIQRGNGPGLSDYRLGQKGGTETVTLTSSQMPSHNHGMFAGAGAGTVPVAPNNYIALNTGADSVFTPTAPQGNTQMGSSAIGNSGGGRSHENRPPYLAITFQTCLFGIFPSRN